VKLVPATKELLREYYGDTPLPTIRAFMVVDEAEKPVGIGGFVRMRDGRMMIFTEGREGVAEGNKKLVIKLGRLLIDIADKNRWTLVAIESELETAERFIKHFGFELNSDGEYVRWPVLQQRSPT